MCLLPLFQGNVAANGNASDLPTFTSEESNMVKGSVDFQGINHYTTNVRMSDRSIEYIRMGDLEGGALPEG